MQNLRKLCLSGGFGDLVGTTLKLFPMDAGFCAAVKRVQRRGIMNPENAGFCLQIWKCSALLVWKFGNALLCCTSGDSRKSERLTENELYTSFVFIQ